MMLLTWVQQPTWPKRDGDPDMLQRVTLAGYEGNIATGATQEYLLPVRPGDRIGARDTITDISAQKKTRLGEGHFVTQVTKFVNHRLEVVGKNTGVYFRYRK